MRTRPSRFTAQSINIPVKAAPSIYLSPGRTLNRPRRTALKPLSTQQPLPDKGFIYTSNWLEGMPTLPAESVRLILTAPPYNLKNSTGNGLKNGRGRKWENAALKDGYKNHEDPMPYENYLIWQRKCLTEMTRLLRSDGTLFYNHKWCVQGGFLQDRSDIVKGFPSRQMVIWQRSGGINFNPGYFPISCEVTYLIAKPKFTLAPKTNAMGDRWKIPQERCNAHPASFPRAFAQRYIESARHSPVLDPFLGSGFTAVAAETLKDNMDRYWEIPSNT